jgi:hypothetical protein
MGDDTKRFWGSSSASDSRDHSRSDTYNNLDDPLKRYIEDWPRRRLEPDIAVREWTDRADPVLPVQCKFCCKAFLTYEEFVLHRNEQHGGPQRNRNALLCHLSLAPYVVKGQEIRAVAQNYSEFYARSAMGWEQPTPEMFERLASSEGLGADQRRSPRCMQAYVFFAWREELYQAHLSGPSCFRWNLLAVAKMLCWMAYWEEWQKIPQQELEATAVWLRIGNTREERRVLLHKRRVSEEQRLGAAPAPVSEDCYAAFSPKKSRMCRFALANHLWLGRWHPRLRDANFSTRCCLPWLAS